MAIVGRSKKWELSNSLWILFSLIPFCYFMSFFYVADRVGTRKNRIWAWVHMAVAVSLILLMLAGVWEAFLFSFLHHCVVIVHCLIIRKRFLREYSQRGDTRFESGKTTKWKLVNSLWILLSLTSLYFIGYFYIGLKTGNRAYKLQGLLHMLLEAVLVTAFVYFVEEIFVLFLIWHQLLVICLCLITRKKYLKLLARHEATRNFRAELANVMEHPETEPARPMDVISSTASTVQPEPETDEKLNVNSCSEEELCRLPGVGIVEAKKVMDHRSRQGEFRSVEEFISVAGLKPHMAVRIVDRITAEPVPVELPVGRPGRRLLDI